MAHRVTRLTGLVAAGPRPDISSVNDPLASVTADVYDMGSELGAFGIYSSIPAARRLVIPILGRGGVPLRNRGRGVERCGLRARGCR